MSLSPTSLIMTCFLMLVLLFLSFLVFSADGKITRHGKGYCFDKTGMPFEPDKFLYRHPQWNYLLEYLFDRPAQPWTVLTAGQIK
jgi:hypothetical protein